MPSGLGIVKETFSADVTMTVIFSNNRLGKRFGYAMVPLQQQFSGVGLLGGKQHPPFVNPNRTLHRRLVGRQVCAVIIYQPFGLSTQKNALLVQACLQNSIHIRCAWALLPRRAHRPTELHHLRTHNPNPQTSMQLQLSRGHSGSEQHDCVCFHRQELHTSLFNDIQDLTSDAPQPSSSSSTPAPTDSSPPAQPWSTSTRSSPRTRAKWESVTLQQFRLA
ncbi:hypothetical protein BU25DRAFT_466052 [Macroventuria anomochaeta]|uniref:Uncharacterized protein n=1 Tax=Macroventuria anomochaeta TaxID=301207 RepID=A0ACB6S746_9PLEO|nr:uncharacterized protein BU25DRAFT_466052 [Macroventuria anomochaeta]KAF2629034.1 hypothetical protein BU25DRAFT_466052 [Macroventuria anomochaeta]